MTAPRVGEIWELSAGLCATSAGQGRSGHLVRITGGPLRKDDGEGAAFVMVTRDLADDEELLVGCHEFQRLVRVHPPAEEETCVVCGRANGDLEPGGKRVLLMHCGPLRCDARVCTMPARAGRPACHDAHFESHRAEIDRENAERATSTTTKAAS